MASAAAYDGAGVCCYSLQSPRLHFAQRRSVERDGGVWVLESSVCAGGKRLSAATGGMVFLLRAAQQYGAGEGCTGAGLESGDDQRNALAIPGAAAHRADWCAVDAASGVVSALVADWTTSDCGQ